MQLQFVSISHPFLATLKQWQIQEGTLEALVTTDTSNNLNYITFLITHQYLSQYQHAGFDMICFKQKHIFSPSSSLLCDNFNNNCYSQSR